LPPVGQSDAVVTKDIREGTDHVVQARHRALPYRELPVVRQDRHSSLCPLLVSGASCSHRPEREKSQERNRNGADFIPVDPLPRLLSNRQSDSPTILLMPSRSANIDSDFYRQLGHSIRLARSAAGRTQEEVAQEIEVTFQQLQKYEKGKNRIPVRELAVIADYLDVPLSHLVKPSAADAKFQALAAKFGTSEFHALMEAWAALKDRSARAALVNLVKCMAELQR
jgi:transcriptional regulator with XRE-family HTH domain